MATNDDKKLYKRRLKNDIDSFLFKFKRQYRQFPVREVTKLSKIRFKPDEKIKVSGYTYNIKEAIRKMKTTYRKLSRKIRPSYFAPTITAYDNDVKNKEKSTEIRSLYGVYKKQLDVEFKGMREDLWFCLYVLRELNRLSTQKTKVLTKELQAPVTESVVFSETDFEQNVDQFGKSKNLIFIAGLSGSGKSTKAAELANKFHAAHIEMDLLEHNQILFDDKNPDEGNRILKEWFEQTFHGPKKLDAESKSFCSTVAKFISYIITYANTHKDRNFVVEGIQLMYMDDATINKMKQFPVIIKGTSILKSMKNAADREGGVVDYAKSFHSLKEIQEYISFYKKDEGFRKTMKRKLTKQVATESALSDYIIDVFEHFENYVKWCRMDCYPEYLCFDVLHEPKTHDINNDTVVLVAKIQPDCEESTIQSLLHNFNRNNHMRETYGVTDIDGTRYFYATLSDGLTVKESAEKVSNQEVYDAVKDYIVTHKSKDIKMLDRPMTHQTKDGNWVLLATLGGDKYRDICEELSKNIKINNKQFDFHSAYLPGDVMLYVKEDELVIETKESEDISMDMFTESVNVKSLANIDKVLFEAVEAGTLSEEDYHVYTNFFTSPIKNHIEKLKNLDIKESVKESVEDAVAEKRLAIYEACQSGIITEDEREMLLNKLISAQVVAESVATATSDTSMSKEEQFDKARLDLYERCEAGMITIEEREDMITEAHDTIFGNTDVVENADTAISAEDRMSGNNNNQTTTPTPGGTDTNQKMDNDVEKDMKKAVEDAQKQMNDIGK